MVVGLELVVAGWCWCGGVEMSSGFGCALRADIKKINAFDTNHVETIYLLIVLLQKPRGTFWERSFNSKINFTLK
jgi:hypothetical protein